MGQLTNQMERSLLKKILEQYTLNDKDTEYLKPHFERFGIMLDKLEHLLKSGYHVANLFILSLTRLSPRTTMNLSP